MKVVYAREELPPQPHRSIFLMGPTPRSEPGVPAKTESWRPAMLTLLRSLGFDGYVFVPEDRPVGGVTEFRGDYADQVEWEQAALSAATVILAWVPRSFPDMPGMATNVEYGMWYDSGKMILGFPTDAEKMKYLVHFAAKFPAIPVAHYMRDTAEHAISMIEDTYNPGCVFCKIVQSDPKGQIEQQLTDSIVIEPLDPVVPGHRLIIPRIHVENFETHPGIAARVMKDAADWVVYYGSIQYNIITSVGKHATQTVFHYHVHVVPRRYNDGLTLPWTGQKKSDTL